MYTFIWFALSFSHPRIKEMTSLKQNPVSDFKFIPMQGFVFILSSMSYIIRMFKKWSDQIANK